MVGMNAPAWIDFPDGSNTRIGPIYKAQTARLRPHQPGFHYVHELRQDRSAEFYLQCVDIQGLVETTRNGMAQIDGVQLGDAEDNAGHMGPTFPLPGATVWMAFNTIWTTQAGLYMRDTNMLSAVRKIPDFLGYPADDDNDIRCPPGKIASDILRTQ